MSPTIEDSGIVYYQPTKFERGEIVVASCPKVDNYSGAYGVPLLKRIVGLPGETIEIVTSGVKINGTILVEDYIECEHKTLRDGNSVNEIVLSDGEYFILGDNRVTSFDSRHVGAIHKDQFLYGITTEPNEYTYMLWTNAAVVAVFNLLIIIFAPILIFVLMTREKHEAKPEKTAKLNNVVEKQDVAVDDVPKRTQPKSKKNQKKIDRAKKEQKRLETEKFIQTHKKH